MDKNNTAPQEALISSFQKFLQDDALRIVEVEALNISTIASLTRALRIEASRSGRSAKCRSETESPSINLPITNI